MEIDATFYATPGARTIAQWLQATPEGFRFTCKMPREITHGRRLRECAEPLRAFLAGVAPLRPKLGPILIQLPPTFEPANDELALREFLFNLPTNYSFAVEFRHQEWHQPRIAKLLENLRICWVWNDTNSLREQNRAPFTFLPQTTDWLYIRLLGDLRTRFRGDGKRAHRYTQLTWPRNSALESWALKVKRNLPGASQVYVFANNHYEGFSPQTCARLARHLGINIDLPRPGDSPAGNGKRAERESHQLELFP